MRPSGTAGIKDRIIDEWQAKAQCISPDKITVQELADICGISRQTFYKYFRDIIDVMKCSFERELKSIR